MKKLFLFLAFTLISLSIFSQAGAATATRQDSLIRVDKRVSNFTSLIKLNSDTTAHIGQMVRFTKSFNTSVTYSIASACFYGDATANSFSMALGSGVYELQSIVFIDMGGNNGSSPVIVFMTDTMNGTDNVKAAWTVTRMSKILDIHRLNVGDYTISSYGIIRKSVNIGNYQATKQVYTGNLYYVPMVEGVIGASGQKMQFVFTFRRIH